MTDTFDITDMIIHPLGSKYVDYKSFKNSRPQASWLKDINEHTFSNVLLLNVVLDNQPTGPK